MFATAMKALPKILKIGEPAVKPALPKAAERLGKSEIRKMAGHIDRDRLRSGLRGRELSGLKGSKGLNVFRMALETQQA